MSEQRRFTENDVDTALCIWEHILEQTRFASNKPSFELTENKNKWELALESDGTAQMRYWAAQQIDYVWEAFELAGGGEVYGLSFDWDFVPAFMERAYDDELNIDLGYEDIAKAIFEEAAL